MALLRPAGILPMPTETSTPHIGRPYEKTLQKHPHSCKALGARPVGLLAQPHGIAPATRREENPISKRQHLWDPNGYTRRCSGATVGDGHKGPLNNRGKSTYLHKKHNANEPKTHVRQTHGPTAQVAPTAHQTFDPATLGWNSASLEEHDTAQANLHLARGLVAPSGEVLPFSGAGRPLEQGPVSLGGWTPPRAKFRLARGPHGLAASAPAPPTGAFNVLTFAGAQVKDESTPRRAWESCPGAVPPTSPVRPSPPLCDAVRHGRCQSCDTVPPTLIRLTCRALERGRRNPQRGDGRLFHAFPGLRRDVRPARPVTSVAVNPVWPSLPSQHHPARHP
jgi:hypothetical protein